MDTSDPVELGATTEMSKNKPTQAVLPVERIPGSSEDPNKWKDGLPERPSVFLNTTWYDADPRAAFPRAVRHGLIRYGIDQSKGINIPGIEYDFEVSLYVWLNSLGLDNVYVVPAQKIEECDIVLGISTLKSDIQETNSHAHFVDFISPVTDQRIPVIELNPLVLAGKSRPATYLSVTEARTRIASGERLGMWQPDYNEGPDISFYHPISELIGIPSMGSREFASSLVHSQSLKGIGDIEGSPDGPFIPAIGPLIHEVGHVFGLADSYFKEGRYPFRPARYPTVMSGYDNSRTLCPTSTDVERVKEHIGQSNQSSSKRFNLCARLFGGIIGRK